MIGEQESDVAVISTQKSEIAELNNKLTRAYEDLSAKGGAGDELKSTLMELQLQNKELLRQLKQKDERIIIEVSHNHRLEEQKA